MKRSPIPWYSKRKSQKPKAPSKRRKLEDMSHSELVQILDAELSLWVRASVAAYSAIPGYVFCYTCGKLIHWKEADCGHYIPRVHHGTRWDLRNLRPQCTTCNSYNEGEHWKFRQALVVEIGEKEVKALELTASMWGSDRHSREYLLHEIQEWREKNKPLQKWAKGEGA